MLCLGLDSGTTTCKGFVLDADTGKVIAQASVPHSFVEGLLRGHVEQNPHIWSDAAERVILNCLEKIGERRGEVVAFGVSAQQLGLVTLDDRNQPVRPAKLWCDTSTAEQAEKRNRALGTADALIERTGNTMVPGYTAPKILSLKENEPENFAATRTILLPHDFLNFWLTGERQIEYGDASGTGLLDIRSIPGPSRWRIYRQSAWCCDSGGLDLLSDERRALQLEKIVKSAVKTDRKTRAELRKENQELYAELRGRQADLTRKLVSSGYL